MAEGEAPKEIVPLIDYRTLQLTDEAEDLVAAFNALERQEGVKS